MGIFVAVNDMISNPVNATQLLNIWPYQIMYLCPVSKILQRVCLPGVLNIYSDENVLKFQILLTFFILCDIFCQQTQLMMSTFCKLKGTLF